MMNRNIIIALYNDIRTVFRLNDIAMLVGETNFQSLNKKLNYYVHTGNCKIRVKASTQNQSTIPKNLHVPFLPLPIFRLNMFCKKRELFFNTIQELL